LEGFLEPFIYDLVNRRDPFLPYSDYAPDSGTGASSRPLTPAQRFDLDQLKLVGIMWDVKDPKAMFMDPDQDVLVLGRDEGIGNRSGYIAAIREGEVVVVEALRRRGDIIYKTRVLRIER
jgi:Tfp pilus assembly protein PilP